LIVLLLFYSFRGFWAVVLVLFPLGLGLLWSFALVPLTFGSLNLITSFLTVILFGLGADYPIHIVKRFQVEIQTNDLRSGTFCRSGHGLSVVISAITTAAGFFVAVFSDFRAFTSLGVEFGFNLTIMMAMFTAFPPALIIVWKRNVCAHAPVSRRGVCSRRGVTVFLVVKRFWLLWLRLGCL
jgi:predicted RND superfamily exporter protein